MQEIKLLDDVKIVTGPLAIGEDWPGVFLSAKYLHQTFDDLIKDMSDEDKVIWFAKAKEIKAILDKSAKETNFEKRVSMLDVCSKLRSEINNLLKFHISDVYKPNSVELNVEKYIKHEIKNQLAETVDYKDTGTMETTLKIQKINSFITKEKNFRIDSGVLKIDDQYGYFLRGDHTFYITGASSTSLKNISDKNMINYCNILLSCLVI